MFLAFGRVDFKAPDVNRRPLARILAYKASHIPSGILSAAAKIATNLHECPRAMLLLTPKNSPKLIHNQVVRGTDITGDVIIRQIMSGRT